MKKSALLCAMLLTVSATALAYDNVACGYKLKIKEPSMTIQTEKMYSYTDEIKENKPMVTHAVNSYSAADVEATTGHRFTTDAFLAQHKVFAEMQKTPEAVAATDLKFVNVRDYAEKPIYGDLSILAELNMPVMKNVNPEVTFTKVDGCDAVTETFFVKQKGMESALASTMVSKNNRLYIFSTVTVDKKTINNGVKLTVGDYLAMMDITPATKEQMSAEFVKKTASEHNKYLKKVILTEAKASSEKFGYVDKVTGKKIDLPHDWLYAQINNDDKKDNFSMTFATPLKLVRSFNDASKVEQVKQILKNNPSDFNTDADSETYAKIAKLFVKDYDASFVTASMKVDSKHDKDFTAMLASPEITSKEVDAFLTNGLQKIKEASNKAPYDEMLRINIVTHDTKFTNNRGVVDITSNFRLLNTANYNSILRFSGNKETMHILNYNLKDGTEIDDNLNNVIEKY